MPSRVEPSYVPLAEEVPRSRQQQQQLEDEVKSLREQLALFQEQESKRVDERMHEKIPCLPR